MPNWCEGTLKVRGTKSNLIKFVLKGLHPVDYYGNDKESLEIDEHSFISSDHDCWIESSERGFVEGLHLDIDDLEYEDEDTKQVIFLHARFAWRIEANSLLEVCKKYNVDMRIYGFERGMEFNQEIEIIDGEITIDREITFDDYRWKCPFPDIGG